MPYTRRQFLGLLLRRTAAAPIVYAGALEVVHRAWWSRNPVIGWIADTIERILPH